MKDEAKTSMAVKAEIADNVRTEAAKARLSVYEYVNQALSFFLRHGTVKIETERRDGSQVGG